MLSHCHFANFELLKSTYFVTDKTLITIAFKLLWDTYSKLKKIITMRKPPLGKYISFSSKPNFLAALWILIFVGKMCVFVTDFLFPLKCFFFTF